MLDADKAIPELDVEIGGKTYKFVFSVKALILAERETGTNVFKGDLLNDVTLGQLVTLVWAGLQKHHPDVKRDIIEDAITFEDIIRFRTTLNKGLQRSAPPQEAQKKTAQEKDSSLTS